MSGHSSWSSTRIGSREHGVVLQELFIAKKNWHMLFITNKASNINQGLGCGGETDQNPQT